MERMMIRYTDEALPDLIRLAAEGKVIIYSSANSTDSTDSDKAPKFDRNHDVIPPKGLAKPIESFIGSISKETGAEWLKRIKHLRSDD